MADPDPENDTMRALLLLLALPVSALAQGMDIWLFDRSAELKLVTRVTDREGYDNQPAFTHDGKALLFSSDRAGEQIDLFRFVIATGEIENLTNTPDENEFSPQDWRGEALMFVLQEGVPYQHLWRRAWDGGERERALTSYVPVGYYARNEGGTLFWGRYAYALFHEAADADVGPGAGESLRVIDQAGRSIHAIPDSMDFSFVHKQLDWQWVIKRLDPATGAITPLAPISNANEDYCWTPDDQILMARGATLLSFDPSGENGWQEVGSLAAPGFETGGRCTVSRDGRHLAFVSPR
ncbi:MAG: hypothetical protein AAGE01_22245 [Pseudomonadota bacterium]